MLEDKLDVDIADIGIDSELIIIGGNKYQYKIVFIL
jgi:hypothetical protein